jgi:hypothetical protein
MPKKSLIEEKVNSILQAEFVEWVYCYLCRIADKNNRIAVAHYILKMDQNDSN